ncbi:hypothetical protein [Mesoterricola silvestris]|uniref:Penicillin-binding protein transpeptidase domain-containing protein n=1 Tax=Mesoterricola silvestris TaxID=2927979 RepID=A0AA48GJL4_9BACT|nr:hypothetical protein [Mesoterricola silvestris]BDU74201.1 hypothetical protein METEAL_33750 [Mesoterricola silvestris]
MRGLLLALALTLGARPPELATWRLEGSRVEAEPPSGDAPLPVGSLQKPFVVRAWARSHAGPSPRFRCRGCWLKAGHGELGLARAVAVSCNAYFLELARQTPLADLKAALAAEGFAPAPLSPEDAVGLAGNLAIRPSALLEAYRRLTLTPWPEGETLRQEVLQGLREAALTGTAAGLGHRGFWAKTGTVPAPDGDPLSTCGLALAVDDTGWAVLGRLRPGTGREAATALAPDLDRWRPWAPRRGPRRAGAVPSGLAAAVRVRLFELLGPRRFQVRNLGPDPVPLGPGHLGPGASAPLAPGIPVGPGLLELSAPGIRRRIQGEVALRSGVPVATLAPRDYVAGVVDAELPGGSPALRVELGAAVLRFLARGPRHPGADVCDSTHCAYFVGRGPRLDWTDPARAAALPGEPRGLDEAAWSAIQEAARFPGPDQWTAHCGGQPLSPRFVWGSGGAAAPPCPRHPTPAAPWTRTWTAAQVAKAFGSPVERMETGEEDGTWVLRLWQGGGVRTLRFDPAHRLLAGALGWDALPSPADAVEAVPGGFRARGRGQGHRVGLCLAEP